MVCLFPSNDPHLKEKFMLIVRRNKEKLDTAFEIKKEEKQIISEVDEEINKVRE